MTDSDSDPDSQATGTLPSRRRQDLTATRRVDPREVLANLESLEVAAWENVAGDATGVEHLAPAAEDFYETFGVGRDRDRVPTGDANGVALAAIQGLSDRLEEQRRIVERQDEHIEAQRTTIARQRADIESLRERLESLQSTVSRLRREVRDADGD